MRYSLALFLLFVLLPGCGGSTTSSTSVPQTLALTSTAFTAGGNIPAQYRCTGQNISPPLAWTGGATAQSYALIVEDPDAPGGIFVHWVLYNIPGATRALAENASPAGPLPGGTQRGTNDFQQTRYIGPCPPGARLTSVFFPPVRPERQPCPARRRNRRTGAASDAGTGASVPETWFVA